MKQVILPQAFDKTRYPRNAWTTMLELLASDIRGGAQNQNRAIAFFMNVSERQVRRWRNDGSVPSPRDWDYYFTKIYAVLGEKSPSRDMVDGRLFFPIGFQVMVPKWSEGNDWDDIAEAYHVRENAYVKPVNPAPNVKPIALTTSMRGIHNFLTGEGEIPSSGASEIFFERAVNPNKIWPTEIEVNRFGESKEIIIEHLEGYLDFFNPYDLPVMAARILALIQVGTSSMFGSANNISSALTTLYFLLIRQYGFYEPGETKRPNVKLDRTANFMRWLQKMIGEAASFDESSQKQYVKRAPKPLTPEQRDRRNARARERYAKKKGGKK